MTNLIIASFSEEARAIEASHKLNELEIIGDITIYEMTLIKKPAEGDVAVLQADDATEGLRTIFVDSSLTPLGATLIRTDVNYEYDEQSDEEMEEFEEDIADERAKIKSATAEEKSKIQKKIAKLKDKRKDRIAELKEKVKEAASEVKTSVKDRKISKIRNNIEKHQKKIAALENKLQQVLGKDQKEVDQKAVAH